MKARPRVPRPLLMAVAAAVTITAITTGCGERGSPTRDQRWQRDIAYLARRLAARALAILRRNPGYRLIIDLRDNGGGDSQPFQNVANQIAGYPAIDKPGRIIGLVDTQTDSSATLDAQILKQQLHGVLIGQAPGDPVNEFGNDGKRLRLPYFDVVVQYTTKVVNRAQARMGGPDIVVAPTLRQLLAGEDPVLAAALSWPRAPGELAAPESVGYWQLPLDSSRLPAG